MLLFKLFLFFIPMALLASEVVWDGNGAMSANEQKKAIREYVQMKYPDAVKAWDVKIKREKREKRERKYTVTINGLMWQDNKDAKTVVKDWKDAKNYCANLQFAGYGNWYLPSKEQLQQLYLNKDRLKNLSLGYYWSSTTEEYLKGSAWVVRSFSSVYNSNKDYNYYVRCVRD